MAESQNGLNQSLNIDAHFATNAADSPLENPRLLDLESPLWQYACQVYSKVGVEAALLALQDDHGADINLILQALWLASEGKIWTEACIPNDYDQWMKEQVLPLRQMRRSMKTGWPEQEGFRQQVKTLELKAEQYALAMLFASSGQGEKNETGSVMSNLIKLAEASKISFEKFEALSALV